MDQKKVKRVLCDAVIAGIFHFFSTKKHITVRRRWENAWLLHGMATEANGPCCCTPVPTFPANPISDTLVVNLLAGIA